ncbi:MAG TPA: potassium-transporting ATPase subunit KdpA, partial [Neisseriales bacterium]|nr:potassium-transporting ATPase subunit KdpA [Neisseriales bacterium]
NTAISFVGNTNWQAYAGETTMSYFTQMSGLAVQNFVSAATGIAVVVALIRGFGSATKGVIGNFWSDLTKATLYILLPLSLIFAVVLLSQGVPQNFNNYVSAKVLEPQTISQTIAGKTTTQISRQQILPMGPVASQEAIKMLGTNGGGFFNANSAHPYENPNALSNFIEMLAILLIPAALCFAFGNLVNDKKQGYTLFIAMTAMFIILTLILMSAEMRGNPLFNPLHIDQLHSALQSGGNMEGKETRFGIFGSGLFAAVTTAASCGAINAAHDSLLPMGGFVPLFLMQLSEVVYGGVGSGLYGMLVFAILAVFICGLMIGRTPEYLGKKIESFEMKMTALIILIIPMIVLLGTAVSLIATQGLAGMSNPSAHGLSEVLYAFTSAANNNGSAFAGLNANTHYYNLMLGAAIFLGRFGVIVPVLAIAGSLAMKKKLPVTVGTMPTTGTLFIAILIGTIIIVGALTYVPSLALGPIVEHLQLFK